MKLVQLERRPEEILHQLFDVWEKSVRATHLFLSENDIRRLSPLIKPALSEIEILVIARNGQDEPAGFMGIGGEKLEMLFIHPDFRGKGLGRQMLETAIREHHVRRLDVNEQNPQARGFYEHLGFTVESRSEVDDFGNNFPILHMVWKAK